MKSSEEEDFIDLEAYAKEIEGESFTKLLLLEGNLKFIYELGISEHDSDTQVMVSTKPHSKYGHLHQKVVTLYNEFYTVEVIKENSFITLFLKKI